MQIFALAAWGSLALNSLATNPVATDVPQISGTEVVNLIPMNELQAYDVNSEDDLDLEFHFILTVKDGTASAVLARLEAITDDDALVHARILESSTFSEIPTVISIKCSIGALAEISSIPDVQRVEDDRLMVMLEMDNWGIDRIDQEDLPLDGKYDPVLTGAGQYVYVIDTGVTLSHQEFGNRGIHGYDFVDKDNDSTDLQGHGTHCAGSAVGAEVGVARDAYVVGVRVLDHNGSGYTSNVIAGINWAVKDAKSRTDGGGSVLSLSLGGGFDAGMNNAIKAAREAGIIPVVAAGNENGNACAYSPASAEEAITVGSATKDDDRSYFSNYGPCVDIFGPGSFIYSASHQSDTGYRVLSGTSMATPHVAGVVATLLEKHGGASADPQVVIDELLATAALDKIPTNRLGYGTTLSPNLMLQMADGQRKPTVSPTVSPTQSPTFSFFAQCEDREMVYAAANFGPSLAYDWPAKGVGFYINSYGCNSGEYIGIDKHSQAIAIVPRGSCSFEKKVREAQKWSQVVGVIIVNNDDTLIPLHRDQDSDVSDIRVPSIMVGSEHADALRVLSQSTDGKMQCAMGTVNYNTPPPTPPTPLPTAHPTSAPSKPPTPRTNAPTRQPTAPPRFMVDGMLYQFAEAEFGAPYPSDRMDMTIGVSENAVGCTGTGGITESMTGKMVLILRGICSFYEKVKNAQDAGAAAVVVMNNINDDLFRMGMDPQPDEVIIPSIFIGKSNGLVIAGKVRDDPSIVGSIGSGAAFLPPTHEPTPEPTPFPTEGDDYDGGEEENEDDDYEETDEPTRSPTFAPTSPPSVAPPPDGIVCPADITSCGKDPSCTWWEDVCIMDRLALTKNKGSKCTGLKRRPCKFRRNRDSCEWTEFMGSYHCLDVQTKEPEPAPEFEVVIPDECKMVKFEEANDYCEENGMRLCNVEEIRNLPVDRTCKFNAKYVWTADTCSNGRRSIGFRRNGKRRRCSNPVIKRGLQCCKDLV